LFQGRYINALWGLYTPLAGDVALDADPIDLWDAWLFAEADASLALEAWTCAATDEKAMAYAAYKAALNREEQAALVLARCVLALRVREPGSAGVFS
jgi:hypothetical protein